MGARRRRRAELSEYVREEKSKSAKSFGYKSVPRRKISATVK
jgi:hypothetical protein